MRRFLWLLLLALGLGTKRHWHILFAIVSGAMVGLWLSDAQYAPLHQLFEFTGQLFMGLVTMLVIPLVISSLVIGMTAMGDSQSLGRLGGRVLGWFMLLMVIGALLGLGLGLLAHPGDNLQLALRTPDSPLAALAALAPPAPQQVLAPPSLSDLFLAMIPTNFFHSLAEMQLIPVVLFTLVFSAALTSIGDAGRPLVQFFESVFATTMKLTDWVLVFAVPGIFSITLVTVARSGPEVFSLLAPYALITIAGLMIQAFILYPLMLRLWAKVDFLNFYRAISEAVMVAFGTASSSASLPVTIACCERRAGISSRIASFVLPTGASLNKAGTTLFEVVGVLFLVQAFGLKLSWLTIAMVGGLSILASIAAPGVPSAGIITMAVVINSMGSGYQSLLGAVALLWPIDRILDMCRTCVNVLSSCTVAAIVASDEGELNRDVLTNRADWQEVL